jgi:small subunit ribosomal protein S6
VKPDHCFAERIVLFDSGYGSFLKNRDCFTAEAGARDQKEVNRMGKYELAVVVNAQIDDEARTAVVDRCKELIARFGGTVGEVDDWGKKKLAYEIQKMNEGYYYFIKFEAEGSAIAEIESFMRIMDNVLRYLCVKQEAA